MKQTIRLNESQFNNLVENIVKESVKKVLNEGDGVIDTLKGAWNGAIEGGKMGKRASFQRQEDLAKAEFYVKKAYRELLKAQVNDEHVRKALGALGLCMDKLLHDDFEL